jgi:hypothetical protein
MRVKGCAVEKTSCMHMALSERLLLTRGNYSNSPSKHTHFLTIVALAVSIVAGFGNAEHRNDYDLHGISDQCEYENGDRVDEQSLPIDGMEISLEAFGHPSEGHISVFFGLFDEFGGLIDRCGSSYTSDRSCDLVFSVGDKSTPPAPLLEHGDTLLSDTPQDKSVSLVRNRFFYFGNLVSGWHTLSLALIDVQGQVIATKSTLFEWDPPPALPLDIMESALLKLSKQPQIQDKSHSSCSSVHKLTWSGFECSLPRAIMRAFELRNVQVTQHTCLQYSNAMLQNHGSTRKVFFGSSPCALTVLTRLHMGVLSLHNSRVKQRSLACSFECTCLACMYYICITCAFA